MTPYAQSSSNGHRAKSSHSAGPPTELPPPYSPSPERVRSKHLHDEVDVMYERLTDASTFLRPKPGSRAVIGIVSNERFASKLAGAIRDDQHVSMIKRAFNKLLKASRPEPPIIEVVTADGLQEVVEDLQDETECTEIVIVIHSSVGYISFDVSGTYIDTLSIHQCERVNGDEADSLISGASTFAGTRMDELDGNFTKEVYLGVKGVGIDIDPSRRGTVFANFQNMSSWSTSRIDYLSASLKDTQGYATEAQWWDKWKGPAAGLLGLAAGYSTNLFLSLKASAGGVFLQYNGTSLIGTHAIKIAAGKASLSTVVAAGGQALLIGGAGAVAAAAVYFIEWDRFFGWLYRAFNKIAEMCRNLWSWFTSWFSDFKNWVEARFTLKGSRMAFSG
ncbi:hypothetical protein ACHAQA_009443 [Verticillium albo-atrum]